MNPPIIFLPINEITVGKRRRTDHGDISELSDSIQKWGLLSPLIVDDERRLVAGERRLKALKQLGFEEAPVRFWGTLTDAELRELELEENLQRKDLTPSERSRNLAKLAETAKEIDHENNCAESAQLGPRQQPGSLRRVSERIGVPESTIRAAQEHVSIVDEIPEIVGASQAQALKIKSKLDAMPTEERAATVEKIKANDPIILPALVDLPPIPADSENPHAYAARKRAGQKWREALADIRMHLNSVRDHGGISETTKKWTPEERLILHQEIDRLIEQLTVIREELGGLTDAA